VAIMLEMTVPRVYMVGFGSSIPGRGGGTGNSSLLHCIQTGSGAHLPSYPIGTWGSFPRGTAARV